MKLEEYRESVDSRLSDLTVTNATQTTDIAYIKEGIDTITKSLETQNGRIRKNEKKLSWLGGVGAVLSVVFSGVIGWIFKTKL